MNTERRSGFTCVAHMAECTAPNHGLAIRSVELHLCRLKPSAFSLTQANYSAVSRHCLVERSRSADLPIRHRLAADLSKASSTTSFRFHTALRDVYTSQLSTAWPGYLEPCRLIFGSRPTHSFRFHFGSSFDTNWRTQEFFLSSSSRAPEQNRYRVVQEVICGS